MTNTRTVHLWLFPREDFAAWKEQCCDRDEVADYETYCRLLDDLGRDAFDRGWHVQVIGLTVAEMLAALAGFGFENTSENRARVIASPELPVGHSSLGLSIAAGAIGWTLIGTRGEVDEATAPTLRSAVDAARAIFDKT